MTESARGLAPLRAGGIEPTDLTGLAWRASSFRPPSPATIDHDHRGYANICDISAAYMSVYIAANLAAFTLPCPWLTAVLRGACNPNKSPPGDAELRFPEQDFLLSKMKE